MYPSDLLYSKEHEWLRVEEDSCVVGITDFAQQELGEVVFVELPEPGDTFEAGDEIGTIESVKAVAEVYTPVAGEIAAVNVALADAPEAVNDDPHGAGWLIKVKMAGEPDLSEMMNAEQYEKFASGDES
jgi:glycine cleavage system H protein